MTTLRMREASGKLTDYWYAAARFEQVTAKAPLSRRIMEEDLVLWRTSDGDVVCTTDQCRHRNALLSEGELFDDCIGCPYHGWTYDRTGQCVHVPSEGPNGAVAGVGHRLRTFETIESDGLVWVWMGYNAPHRAPFQMPHWRRRGFRAYYMETMFDNEVTNLVENFMDVPHTVFVHKGWFRSTSSKKVKTTVERTEDSVLVTYDQPRDSIGFSGRLVNPKALPMVHTDKFYLPNNTRVDYVFGDHEKAFVITSTCTPVRPFRTRVFTLVSYKLGWLNFLGALFLPWYTKRVIQQDVKIMAVQGRSLMNVGAPDFQSTRADLLHTDIESLREWACAGGNDPAPAPKTEVMELFI